VQLWTKGPVVVDDAPELEVCPRNVAGNPCGAGLSPVELLPRNPARESGIGRRRRSAPQPPGLPGGGGGGQVTGPAGSEAADGIDRERHQYRSAGDPLDHGLVPRPTAHRQKGPCRSYRRGPFSCVRYLRSPSPKPAGAGPRPGRRMPAARTRDLPAPRGLPRGAREPRPWLRRPQVRGAGTAADGRRRLGPARAARGGGAAERRPSCGRTAAICGQTTRICGGLAGTRGMSEKVRENPCGGGVSGRRTSPTHSPRGERDRSETKICTAVPQLAGRQPRWPGDGAAGVGGADGIDRERHQYRSR